MFVLVVLGARSHYVRWFATPIEEGRIVDNLWTSKILATDNNNLRKFRESAPTYSWIACTFADGTVRPLPSLTTKPPDRSPCAD